MFPFFLQTFFCFLSYDHFHISSLPLSLLLLTFSFFVFFSVFFLSSLLQNQFPPLSPRRMANMRSQFSEASPFALKCFSSMFFHSRRCWAASEDREAELKEQNSLFLSFFSLSCSSSSLSQHLFLSFFSFFSIFFCLFFLSFSLSLTLCMYLLFSIFLNLISHSRPFTHLFTLSNSLFLFYSFFFCYFLQRRGELI